MRSHKIVIIGALTAVSILGLTACGPSAEETRASADAERVSNVDTMCVEANSVLAKVGLNEMFPTPTDDWGQIENTYGDVKTKLQSLSERASGLNESQLARDFASVGKAAGHMGSIASLVASVGYGAVVSEEWMSGIHDFSNNEGLKAPSNLTFIGCK